MTHDRCNDPYCPCYGEAIRAGTYAISMEQLEVIFPELAYDLAGMGRKDSIIVYLAHIKNLRARVKHVEQEQGKKTTAQGIQSAEKAHERIR